jgi:hypothetical protein
MLPAAANTHHTGSYFSEMGLCRVPLLKRQIVTNVFYCLLLNCNSANGIRLVFHIMVEVTTIGCKNSWMIVKAFIQILVISELRNYLPPRS